jgi:hypothetical protein
MKKIKNWFKDKTDFKPNDHAKELMISLMFNSDTEHQINTFECLKQLFESELRKKEIESSAKCRLINFYLPSRIKQYDANFDKPLSEINVKL